MSKLKTFLEDEKERAFNDGVNSGYRSGFQEAMRLLPKYKEQGDFSRTTSSYHSGLNNGLDKQFSAIENGLSFEYHKIIRKPHQ